MEALFKRNVRFARLKWGIKLDRNSRELLRNLTGEYSFSIAQGDLIWLNRSWYVTHTGLIRLARKNRCAGIHTKVVTQLCKPELQRWAFEAIAYRTKTCRGFVGYGDADPSNVSYLVQGAEMRVAETRAVNRALRKAYGIGICSIEEIGSLERQRPAIHAEPKKLPQAASGCNGAGGRTVRDQLCQIIRQHELDPGLVKSHAADFCGTQTLREATREQVENFVQHLADWAEKDRNGLLCQLNSYMPAKEGAA